MFQSKVPLTVAMKTIIDNRDTAWNQEVDRKKFWNNGGNVWTKTPRVKMGPRINSRGCGPDVVMYEVDSTRVVSKYVPLSKGAGCDKVALPPRAKRPGNTTPRSQFLVEQSTASGPPLDFSFLQLESASDIARAVDERGIKSPRKEAEVPEEDNNKAKEQQPKKPPSTPQAPKENKDKGKMKVKKVVRSVRLNNNNINSTKGLQQILTPVVENIDDIRWIDLAFNKLTNIVIEDFLPGFQNLTVLNLDSNDIYKKSDIEKLGQFKKLTSLSLHSNPVALAENYRLHVISSIPQLKKLDSSIITPKEREKAIMWRSKLKRATNNSAKTKDDVGSSEQAQATLGV
jgi:hypothetical protein